MSLVEKKRKIEDLCENTPDQMESETKSSEKEEQPAKASTFVVYVYVDYRKEVMMRCLRTYTDRHRAIEFAESLSTKYVPTEKLKRTRTTPTNMKDTLAVKEQNSMRK
jgi:DNA-dependent RNA polymerase auxiliary subunit epsilon